MNWFEKLVGTVLIALAVVFCFGLAWVVYHTPLMIRVENRCAELGYADHAVTWNGRGYCKTRLDHSDVVVPWEHAPCLREPRVPIPSGPPSWTPDDPPENKPH